MPTGTGVHFCTSKIGYPGYVVLTEEWRFSHVHRARAIQPMERSMAEKIVVITGASSGIGEATARLLVTA